MAAKRFLDSDQDEEDQNQPKRKRMKPTFASAIREVIMMNSLQSVRTSLETMLRRAVREEVEKKLKNYISNSENSSFRYSSNSLQIEMAASDHQQRTMKLAFSKKLALPIFTGTKIVGEDGSPLKIVLDRGGDFLDLSPVPQSIKVEILVIDGDFPGGDSHRFAKNVVKARDGKRPLLAGECCVTMVNGVGFVGDIEFTDNSSWIRSRKFRLGARAVKIKDGNFRILEAITDTFVVKDHRGELYKKHYPPSLTDKVWRLEKIGKGGPIHKKLESEGIYSVQDFLKLSIVDNCKLRKIMGGMSERMWESSLRHARTCVMGTKNYRFHGPDLRLTMNPICQLLKIEMSGQVYLEKDFKRMQTAYIQSLVKDAYANWKSLEVVDGQVHQSCMPLLTYKSEIPYDSFDQNERQETMISSWDRQILSDESLEVVDYMSEQHPNIDEHYRWVDLSCYSEHNNDS